MKERKDVKAEYHGYMDLGMPCFSVLLSALRPNVTVKNRLIFRSRVGDEFQIGEQYDVTVEMTDEYHEVIAVHADKAVA